jgi:hypothetical protein
MNPIGDNQSFSIAKLMESTVEQDKFPCDSEDHTSSLIHFVYADKTEENWF